MPFPYVFPFYFESCPPATIVSVTVRMAFGDDMFEAAPTWSDISADVLEVHTVRGRKHELDRMEAGTCILVLNNASGDYYPDNAAGTYYPDIKTMTRVNVRAAYNGGTAIDVFTGYVESWSPAWLGKSGKGPISKVVCSDALKIFARTLLNNAGEAAELSGTRVGNVADEVGWPAGWRDIDTGQETLQATGAQANVNAKSHYDLIQQSELSLIYTAPDNDLQFEDRSHRTNAPHDTALSVFGDDGEAAGEDRYEDIDFVLDEALLYNDVRMTRIGGTEQTASDATSQTAYGVRSLARSGLLNSSDLAASILANFFAARYSDTATRVKSMLIRPGKNPVSLWYKCLNYNISDRLTIRLDQASIDTDYFIEGVQHDWVAKTDSFTTRWWLSDCSRYFYTPSAMTQTIIANAAGDETNINSKTEATNWESVIATTTATYVANTDNETTFDRDLYNVATPAYTNGTISKIAVRGDFLADNDAKTVQGAIKLCVKSGATVDESGEHVVSVATYETITEEWATNPDTAAAWTWADIASLQVGPSIKRATPFGGSTNWTRCKYILVTIYFTPSW